MQMEITKLGDIGTPERHARGELTTDVIEGLQIGRVRKISPIHHYYNRDELDSAQLSAGQTLQNCWQVACLGYSNYAPKERIDSSIKKMEETEARVHAREKLNIGLKAAGVHQQIIQQVVIDEQYISDIISHWYPRKKMKQYLKEALTNIARAYGYC